MLNVRATNIGSAASAADVIAEALREAIVHGEMKDGDLLRQDQIATLFNVSRIPVREALARLEEQGLVTNQRYKGAVVSSLSPDEVAETFEFRALIEGEVVRLSVENISEETLTLAAEHHAAFAAETDSANWAQRNRLFHATLYRDAGRPYFLQVTASALDKVGRYLRAQMILTDGMGRARAEHAEILAACRARDAAGAAELTRAHILAASRSLTEFLERRKG